MSLFIQGLGTAVPSQRIAQAEAAELAVRLLGDETPRARALHGLYARTGVQTRHSVLLQPTDHERMPSQQFYRPAIDCHDRGPTTRQRMAMYESHAIEIAAVAATRALHDAQIVAEEVTQLVTVSCSGFVAPGIDIQLVKALQLSPCVGRTQVGFMGCHGALNAMRVAQAIVESNRQAKVLVVAVELCSLHHQYGSEPAQLVANALFADGAAAMLAVADQGQSGWRCESVGSWIVPNTDDLLRWTIGDHGFEMELSPELPALLRSQLRAIVARWLTSHGLNLTEIQSWAIHPGGPRILEASRESLELTVDALMASRAILASYGNMSSPTVLFIMQKLRDEGARLPCVVLGFGPGLTVEMALLR